MDRYYVYVEDTKIRRYLVEAETSEDAEQRVKSGHAHRGTIIRSDVTSQRRFVGDTELAENEGRTRLGRKYLRRRASRLKRIERRQAADQAAAATPTG